jgi:hypothetical protein
MSAQDALAFIRLKIERANKHISDIDSASRVFFDTKPYKVATKRDPETRKMIYYLSSVDPVPASFATAAGDAIHNLRCSLDHLAQQLYLAGTNGAKGYRNQTSFLITNSAKDFKSSLPGKIEGMRQDAIDAIRALEPYKGGKGEDLWVLHRLNNIDKHRLIVTVGSSFQSFDIGSYMTQRMVKAFPDRFPGGLPHMELFIRPADTLFPLKTGDELFIDAPDAEANEKMNFRFNIAVNEPGVIEGKPLLETLVEFSNRVSGIVTSFEPCLE